jgi:hypothetical protein
MGDISRLTKGRVEEERKERGRVRAGVPEDVEFYYNIQKESITVVQDK